MAEPLESDAAFFAYCERRHRDNVVRFLRAVTQYKAAMLQPLGGRTASSILAEEIVSQYLEPRGPLCVRLTPGRREATLERWRALVAGKDFSRLQRTFFDGCRGEVVEGELAELAADYRAHAARLAAEARETAERRVTLPEDSGGAGGSGGGGRSVLGTVLSSLRRSSESLTGMTLVPRSASAGAVPAATAVSVAAAPGSSPAPGRLPLAVRVGPARGEAMELQVELTAAETALSWAVERTWAEFRTLAAALRRYGVGAPPLPRQERRLQGWLEQVLAVPELSASRDLYVFLNIGRTVDLLAQAARARRSTIAVQHKREAAPAPEQPPEADALAAVSQDDLARALGALELLQEEEGDAEGPPPGLPAARSTGSLRARRTERDGQVSAEDIAAALRHLLGLQFTDSPARSAEEAALERRLGAAGEDEEEEEAAAAADREADREEESSEAETSAPSTANTFGEYPLNVSGGAATAAASGNGNDRTADFDLRAIVREQARTIEALQQRVRELEARLAAK